MKTLLLSVIFSLLIIIEVRCQTYQYVPLIDSTSVMEWKGKCWFYAMQSSVSHINHIIVKGDTVINGSLVRKLFLVDYNGPADTLFWGIITETSDKKVHYETINSGASYFNGFIYDFNLEAGDTMYRPGFVDSFLLVKSIDTVLISSGYRKQFNLLNLSDSTKVDVWIEGIGSIVKGLLATRCGGYYSNNITVCSIYKNDQLLYASNSYMCMGGLMSDDNLEDSRVKIYPNPTNEVLHFELTGHDKFTIKLADLRGQILARFEEIQSGFKLDLTDYPQGLYIVSINTPSQKTIYKRIIKQ